MAQGLQVSILATNYTVKFLYLPIFEYLSLIVKYIYYGVAKGTIIDICSPIIVNFLQNQI